MVSTILLCYIILPKYSNILITSWFIVMDIYEIIAGIRCRKYAIMTTTMPAYVLENVALWSIRNSPDGVYYGVQHSPAGDFIIFVWLVLVVRDLYIWSRNHICLWRVSSVLPRSGALTNLEEFHFLDVELMFVPVLRYRSHHVDLHNEYTKRSCMKYVICLFFLKGNNSDAGNLKKCLPSNSNMSYDQILLLYIQSWKWMGFILSMHFTRPC